MFAFIEFASAHFMCQSYCSCANILMFQTCFLILIIDLRKGFSTSALLTFWIRWEGRFPAECLAASLASGTHPPLHSCNNQNYFQTLPNVPWEIKSAPVENHCCSTNTYHFNKSSSIQSVYGSDRRTGCSTGCIFVVGSFHGQIKLKGT